MALTTRERNYSTFEDELLAVENVVSHFAVFLLYGEFTWRTDHAALRNLFRADLKLSSPVSPRIRALQPYRVKIEQIKGKYNTVTAALSRINSEGLTSSAAPLPSPIDLCFSTLQALAVPKAFRSFEDRY